MGLETNGPLRSRNVVVFGNWPPPAPLSGGCCVAADSGEIFATDGRSVLRKSIDDPQESPAERQPLPEEQWLDEVRWTTVTPDGRFFAAGGSGHWWVWEMPETKLVHRAEPRDEYDFGAPEARLSDGGEFIFLKAVTGPHHVVELESGSVHSFSAGAFAGFFDGGVVCVSSLLGETPPCRLDLRTGEVTEFELFREDSHDVVAAFADDRLLDVTPDDDFTSWQFSVYDGRTGEVVAEVVREIADDRRDDVQNRFEEEGRCAGPLVLMPPDAAYIYVGRQTFLVRFDGSELSADDVTNLSHRGKRKGAITREAAVRDDYWAFTYSRMSSFGRFDEVHEVGVVGEDGTLAVHRLDRPAAILRVVSSASGRHVAVIRENFEVEVWGVEAGARRAAFNVESETGWQWLPDRLFDVPVGICLTDSVIELGLVGESEDGKTALQLLRHTFPDPSTRTNETMAPRWIYEWFAMWPRGNRTLVLDHDETLSVIEHGSGELKPVPHAKLARKAWPRESWVIWNMNPSRVNELVERGEVPNDGVPLYGGFHGPSGNHWTIRTSDIPKSTRMIGYSPNGKFLILEHEYGPTVELLHRDSGERYVLSEDRLPGRLQFAFTSDGLLVRAGDQAIFFEARPPHAEVGRCTLDFVTRDEVSDLEVTPSGLLLGTLEGEVGFAVDLVAAVRRKAPVSLPIEFPEKPAEEPRPNRFP